MALAGSVRPQTTCGSEHGSAGSNDCWRLQEQAFGGLDRKSLTFLDALSRRSGPSRRQLKPGTVLVREYQSQRHTVTVSRDGFD
jgi:Protein of unknown function (DUF2924)